MAQGFNRPHLMALFAGSAAALAMLSTPTPLIEMLVSSTGLSEALPAAAPPLGFTARAMIAGFAAIMTSGIALACNSGISAQGDTKMGFALSRLAAFARGPHKEQADADPVPTLRRADAHPDAPARAPIFASRDFAGADIFARPALSPAPVEEDVAPIVAATGLAMPRSPEPLDDAQMMAVAPARAAADSLSIAELADRFERGLSRRTALTEAAAAAERAESIVATPSLASASASAPMPAAVSTPTAVPVAVLADMPAAAPVPVKRDVDAEIDEALRAALGTLQKMTARAR